MVLRGFRWFCVVLGCFRLFWVVLGGFRWFWVFSGFFRWFWVVLGDFRGFCGGFRGLFFYFLSFSTKDSNFRIFKVFEFLISMSIIDQKRHLWAVASNK